MTETAHKLIADCPNPECGQVCHVATQGDDWTGYIVTCNLCQYQTSIEETPEEAIRVHHLICRPQQSAEPVAGQRPLNLKWGRHDGRGKYHIEWHAPCGCAYHPEPKPHVHPCIKHSEIDPCPEH